MAFKTILLNLNETRRNPALFEQAAHLARMSSGHIAGVYVIPAVQLYPSTAIEAMPVIFEAQREFFQRQRETVKSAFAAGLRQHAVNGDLEVVDSPSPLISDTVIEYGRASDLLVLSQTDGEAREGVELDFVDRVVMAAGRPVLILPLKSQAVDAFGTVIVAWNGRREAARAAFDSLPLLHQAKEVRVIWIDPQQDENRPTGLAGRDLAQALTRHGVNAVAESMPGNGREAGEALLTKIFDTGANLLVMGAYGHARLREFILGGATREVLKNMACPVLFSH